MFEHPASRHGRIVGRILLIVSTAILGLWLIVARPSNAAETTRTEAVVPVSVVVFSQCGKAIAAMLVYSDGSLHPVDLVRTSYDALMKMADKFEQGLEHRAQLDAKCIDHDEKTEL